MSSLSLESDEPYRRHAGRRAALLQAALQSPGATDAALREAAFRGDAVPPALADYARKVRSESYRVTDDDVTRLLAAGYSEDAIFEVTIASAIGAADRRLQAGLRALKST